MERRLLTGVLRAVERSTAYRDPAHWTRPVVIRWATVWVFDPYPEDAERLRARGRAARWLVGTGAATITYEKPPYDDRPRTVRCTAAQLEVLEALARVDGIPPLRDTLLTVRAAWADARSSVGDALPSWWCAYEDRIAAALETPTPTGLGIAADRLVDAWPEWLDGLKAARGIAAGASGYERVVSERVLGHSKRLAELRRAVAAHLVAADPQWADLPGEASASSVLAAYGVRRTAVTLDVAGPVCVEADGSRMDASRIEGLVRLPGQWAAAVAEAAQRACIRTVTTIENETAAWGYVEERGGPDGLATEGELVVYTSGFAATVGADAVAALWRALPAAEFRHWGDADAAGIQIWRDLVRRSGAPLRWWRTTVGWLDAALVRSPGIPLSPGERWTLEQLARDLRDEAAHDPEHAALQCAEALLRAGAKLEQEAFEPRIDAR